MFDNGFMDATLARLEREVLSDPDDPRLLVAFSQLHERSGSGDLGLFEELVELRPGRLDVLRAFEAAAARVGWTDDDGETLDRRIDAALGAEARGPEADRAIALGPRIVPGLLRAVVTPCETGAESEFDDCVARRLAAIRLLTRLKGSAVAAVPRLLEVCASARSRLRLETLIALQSIVTREALPELIRSLERRPEGSKIAAATVLGWLGERAGPARRVLESWRRAGSAELRLAVGEALQRIDGLPPCAELIGRLTAADVVDRRLAARALEQCEGLDREAVPSLVRALEDEDAEVRRAAAGALGEIGPAAAPAAESLAAMLREPIELNRRCALEALRELGPGAVVAVSPLLELLAEGQPRLSCAAAEAVAAIGPAARPWLPVIEALTRHECEFIRRAAERARRGVVGRGRAAG